MAPMYGNQPVSDLLEIRRVPVGASLNIGNPVAYATWVGRERQERRLRSPPISKLSDKELANRRRSTNVAQEQRVHGPEQSSAGSAEGTLRDHSLRCSWHRSDRVRYLPLLSDRARSGQRWRVSAHTPDTEVRSRARSEVGERTSPPTS